MVRPTSTAIRIDWSDDGDYADTGEDVSARVLNDPGIALDRGRDQLRSLAPPMVGAATFDLDNRSKDYSPENASSPIYAALHPGHLVNIRATYASTTYDLHTGYLQDIPQHPVQQWGSVSAPSLGSLSRIKGVVVSTTLYAGITTDVAIGYVLDAAGWPAGATYRTLDTGRTTLAYWWCAEVDAWAMLLQLLATEGPGATLYEDGTGRIVFESRHYRLITSRSTTSQATFGNASTEPKHAPPLDYNPQLQNIINSASATVNQRTPGALAVVWSYSGTLTLGASQVLALGVSSTDPFSAAVCVAGTDYTVAAGGVSSATLSRTSGAVATLTLTAGAGGATVTNLQVRAIPYAKTETSVTATVDTTTSRARYGVRSYSDAIWPEIAANDAQDLVNAIVTFYQAPRATLGVTVNNGHASRLTQQLAREISDRVTVVETQTGLNTDVFIERITHRIRWGGRDWLTVFGCEKALGAATLLTVDSAHAVVDDALAIVSY